MIADTGQIVGPKGAAGASRNAGTPIRSVTRHTFTVVVMTLSSRQGKTRDRLR